MNAVAKTVGIMRAADEALHHPPDDHLVDRGRQPAHQARGGEAGGGDGEENSRPERPRQKSRQRDHHHFGDEIGGLHPGYLVAARRETSLDLRQRGGDDLDVQDRHEHAEDHGEEGDETARLDAIGGGRRRSAAGGSQIIPVGCRISCARHGNLAANAGRSAFAAVYCTRLDATLVRAAIALFLATAPGLVSTLTTTDMPGRSSPCSATAAGTSMRTGRRWTILVKLPVALSGGSKEKTEPEAGATLTTVALQLVIRIGVDRDGDRLARTQIGELRLLEIRVDIDRVERDEAREPLPGLDQVADLHGAITDHAVERRADHGKGQVALCLGQRRLELLERAERFDLLGLQHVDIGLGRFERRLARLHRGIALIAVGLRLFERLTAGVVARGEFLLPLELELGAPGAGLRRHELRLGLVDGGLLGDDLLADAVDGRLLDGDVVARCLDGELVVPIVDARDHIAFVDMSVIVDGDLRHVTHDLGRERRVLRADIGIIG